MASRCSLRAKRNISGEHLVLKLNRAPLLLLHENGRLTTERLTHAEIGQRIGATREMVGRVLRDLARGGYIQAGRDRVTILRRPPPRW